MNPIIRILTKFYSYSLYLYPASYRKAFQEEMFLDFKDMLTDASKEGILSLIAFCLREARDIPLIGLLLGIVFGLLKKRAPTQMFASS